MKDKLTKNSNTKFDRFCNKMRKFSVACLCLAFISFIPLNQKLDSRSKVIETEIVALQEEQEDMLLAKNTTAKDKKTRSSRIYIFKR